MKYTYIIMGDPTPLARIRDGHRRTFDQKHKDKANCILTLANLHEDQPLLSGPLHLEIHFYMPLPKGAKTDSPYQGRPELTDLINYIERCATGIIYSNACIITSISSSKRYSDKPRIELTLIAIKDFNGVTHNNV